MMSRAAAHAIRMHNDAANAAVMLAKECLPKLYKETKRLAKEFFPKKPEPTEVV